MIPPVDFVCSSFWAIDEAKGVATSALLSENVWDKGAEGGFVVVSFTWLLSEFLLSGMSFFDFIFSLES